MTNTLAHAADEFVKSPVEVLGAIAAIVGLVSSSFKPGRLFWLNLWARLRSKPIVPSETLRIVQNVNASFWGPGSVGGKPMMQVVFDGHVTDISGQPNRVLTAEIPKPLTHGDMVLLSNQHDARRPQVLNPRECAELHTMFFVDSVAPDKGKPWHSPIVFTDQYNNRHKVKNCIFKSIESGAAPPPKETEEFPYEITDPVEKEVVSVLKAELSRYAVCGRVCGGLGSVHIVYRGRPFTGVGGDSWTPNSSANQIIVSDPEAASLKSDNLEALVGFYRGLSSDGEQMRFITALFDRLDASRGYLAVSYFIVAVRWSVDGTFVFAETLKKAKRDLPENESRVFGLSNLLMLLNGLLRYRYPDFTNQMLDEIERMTHGLTEHTFLIPAKIAAIRASRLPTSRGGSST